MEKRNKAHQSISAMLSADRAEWAPGDDTNGLPDLLTEKGPADANWREVPAAEALDRE